MNLARMSQYLVRSARVVTSCDALEAQRSAHVYSLVDRCGRQELHGVRSGLRSRAAPRRRDRPSDGTSSMEADWVPRPPWCGDPVPSSRGQEIRPRRRKESYLGHRSRWWLIVGCAESSGAGRIRSTTSRRLVPRCHRWLRDRAEGLVSASRSGWCREHRYQPLEHCVDLDHHLRRRALPGVMGFPTARSASAAAPSWHRSTVVAAMSAMTLAGMSGSGPIIEPRSAAFRRCGPRWRDRAHLKPWNCTSASGFITRPHAGQHGDRDESWKSPRNAASRVPS